MPAGIAPALSEQQEGRGQVENAYSFNKSKDIVYFCCKLFFLHSYFICTFVFHLFLLVKQASYTSSSQTTVQYKNALIILIRGITEQYCNHSSDSQPKPFTRIGKKNTSFPKIKNKMMELSVLSDGSISDSSELIH